MDLLAQIAATADELTEPHMHAEPIVEWDHNRNRKIRRHITVQPGLLTQLYEKVIPSSSSSDGPTLSSTPCSRPPLAVEALSMHDRISMDVLRWCTSLKIDTRVSVESNIRGLVGASAHLDDETADTLLDEMRHWRSWCIVYLGWERLFRPSGVPCPVVDCSARNSLRINLTTSSAMCRACGATWSDADGNLGVLADYVATYTSKAA